MSKALKCAYKGCLTIAYNSKKIYHQPKIPTKGSHLNTD